jgi:hypothetical protein
VYNDNAEGESDILFPNKEPLFCVYRFPSARIRKAQNNGSLFGDTMKNKYVIEGDVVRIFLHGGYETLIDLEDLPKVMKYKGTFIVQKNHKNIYAYVNYRHDNISTPILIHRIVLGIPRGARVRVDHIHHNGLDNRKAELRNATNKENVINRQGRNKNNTSGYRNVCWSNHDQRYLVTLIIDGKRICFGRFKDAAQAGRIAKAMRRRYYGEFAGND